MTINTRSLFNRLKDLINVLFNEIDPAFDSYKPTSRFSFPKEMSKKHFPYLTRKAEVSADEHAKDYLEKCSVVNSTP